MRKFFRDFLLASPGIFAILERWGGRLMDIVGLPDAAKKFTELSNTFDIGEGTWLLLAFSVVGLIGVRMWPEKTGNTKPEDAQKEKRIEELNSLFQEGNNLFSLAHHSKTDADYNVVIDDGYEVWAAAVHLYLKEKYSKPFADRWQTVGRFKAQNFGHIHDKNHKLTEFHILLERLEEILERESGNEPWKVSKYGGSLGISDTG